MATQSKIFLTNPLSGKTRNLTMDEMNEMFSEDKHKALTMEVENYLNCVKGNAQRCFALTDIHTLAKRKNINKDLLKAVGEFLFLKLVSGGTKVGDEDGDFRVGAFGSRWIDLDPNEFGMTSVRCAFYSKKHYTAGKWKGDKPYVFNIYCEM